MSKKTLISAAKAGIEKQIDIFEYILKTDVGSNMEKTIMQMHMQALESLKKALAALESVETEPSPAGRKKTAPTKEIFELRKQGISQEHIARELNISLSTVRRELKAERNVCDGIQKNNS